MKILIKNGKIYDGTGSEGRISNVLIENDKIVLISNDISEEGVDEIVDISGLSLSSGFIDGHSHNDWFAIKKDPLPYFEPFIRQGITTFVAGNCGISAMGFDSISNHVDKLGGGLFFYNDTTGKYGTIAEFFNAINNNCPANIATLVGHCSARAAVAGYENRPLTEEEEKRMLAILEKALQEGAAGISLGLMYEPGLYAPKEELKKVVDLCVKYDKVLSVHPRANSAVSMAYPQLLGRSHLLRAVDELVELSKGTNLKLQYSHAIFVGRRSLKDKKEFVEIMDKLRSEGVDAMFDIYNETMGVSVITVILPGWYQSMSSKQKKKLGTKMKLSLLVKATSLLLGFGFDDILVAYIGKGYEQYEGKTIKQIAKEMKTSCLKAYLKLCELSDFKGRVNMGPYTTEEIIHEFEKHPNCLFMTDAWIEENGIQNPAIYDCYPKFLRDSLLGKGDTIENTIRKMTGAIADRYMLKERGYLKEGYAADLTVFDENEIMHATPDQEKSFGIKKVYINGKLVFENGQMIKNNVNGVGRALPIHKD